MSRVTKCWRAVSGIQHDPRGHRREQRAAAELARME